MKPVLMKISGWGPYKEEQVIDFTKLQDRGIFLITGATGAGKTTVFDAITYALYGNVSGNVRGKDSLRSDFAEETTKTYVELVMMHGSKTYTIYRNPEYMRPKKIKTKNEEYTKEKERAILTMPDGSIVEGISEVTKKIEFVLRMDYRQFKQISMIAQGEFTKLLTANQQEKTEIFRELFHIYFYERFSQILKQKASQLYGGIFSLRDKMEEIVDQTELKGAEWEQLTRNKPYAWDGIKEYLKKEEQEQNIVKKEVEKQIQQIEEKLTKLLQEIEKGKHQNQLWEQKEQAEAEFEQHMLFAAEHQKRKDMLSGAKKAQALQTLELVFQNANIQLQEVAKKVKQFQAECLQLKQYQIQTQTVFEQKEVLSGLFERIEEYERTKTEGKQKEAELQEKEGLLRKSQMEYKKDEEDVSQKRERYQNAERAYQHAMVGIVAELLVEGEPCPVCGSRSHPEIALVEEGTVREDELKSLKVELEKINKKLMESYSKTITIKEETKAQQLIVREIQQRIKNQFVTIQELVTKVQEKLPILEEQLGYSLAGFFQQGVEEYTFKSTKKARQVLCDLVEVRTRKDAEKGEKEKLLEDYMQEVETNQARMEKAQEELQKKKQEQKYQTEEEYEADREQIAQIEELAIQIETYEKRWSALEEYKKRTQEAVKGTVYVVLEELLEQLAKWQETKKSYEEQREQLLICLTQMQKAGVSIQTKLGKCRELEKEYGLIGDLERISAGKNPKKLIFEQYVLSGYFDAVLESANIRFSQMTMGRYELFRAQEGSDGRKRDSLEIEVMDHYTGKKRSVKTLSGGETFKASLALALGMSDRIQSENGGILIETLFVDEGFGSLDEESLAQACETLMKLAEKKQLIGIISHVAELKEKIDNQIVVEKTNMGSKISILQG